MRFFLKKIYVFLYKCAALSELQFNVSFMAWILVIQLKLLWEYVSQYMNAVQTLCWIYDRFDLQPSQNLVLEDFWEPWTAAGC